MEAKELRIGNYVNYFDDGEYSIISTLDWGYVHLNDASHIDYELLKPIPLTEEWLVKFGFYYGDSVDYGYLWLKCKMGEFYVRPSYLGGFYWGFDYNNEINGQNNIKHVHQLQNLYFALTNEELKLK